MNVALQMLFLFLSVTFFLLSAGETHPMVNRVGGWFGVFVAAIAYYMAFAELTNECYRKKIMPLGQMNYRSALPENNEDREDII
ncbi:hypothetical protein WJX81_002825 [Elliptochloris bilobata]|uniref:Uncharacterized protein n=1 Tax=Elliptochloris bilobata TaxID=381761 RepID=A0AAW1RCF3_9CHLO